MAHRVRSGHAWLKRSVGCHVCCTSCARMSKTVCVRLRCEYRNRSRSTSLRADLGKYDSPLERGTVQMLALFAMTILSIDGVSMKFKFNVATPAPSVRQGRHPSGKSTEWTECSQVMLPFELDAIPSVRRFAHKVWLRVTPSLAGNLIEPTCVWDV